MQLRFNLCHVGSFLDKGNVTVYESKYGEPPLRIEPPVVSYKFDEDQVESSEGADLDLDSGEIDFGDLGGGGDDVELETGLL